MIIQRKRSRSGVGAAVVLLSVLSALFATYRLVRPFLLERAADKVLLATPAFQQIARWEPATYRQMKDAAVGSIERGDPPAKVQGAVRGILAKVVKTYIPRASDEAIVEYARVNIDEAEQIAAKDADVAFAMLFGNEVNFDLTKYVDAATQKRDAGALADVIRTGVRNDAGHQNDRRAQWELEKLARQFEADYGKDAELVFTGGRRRHLVIPQRNWIPGQPQPAGIGQPQIVLGQKVEKPRTVELTIVFYRRVFALRTDVAAQVVRLLMSRVA